MSSLRSLKNPPTLAMVNCHPWVGLSPNSGCQVRLVMLQTIGKMLEAGYLEQVEGWPLSYVSLQLAMSAHRLVMALILMAGVRWG